MPTYEYRCETCGETFERFESITEHGEAKPNCPKCGSDKVARGGPRLNKPREAVQNRLTVEVRQAQGYGF